MSDPRASSILICGACFLLQVAMARLVVSVASMLVPWMKVWTGQSSNSHLQGPYSRRDYGRLQGQSTARCYKNGDIR
ncbi:hypothetical protein F5888DRAFT_1735648 [Russula emetica]|nr:hypothetical protein F5888DRAFT_1735648 [Russula emetica]